MRYREVLIGIIGVGLIVFALSYFIYKWFFKKKKQTGMIINIAMIILLFVGGGMFYLPAKEFVLLKKNIVKKNQVIVINNKKVTNQANAQERLLLTTAYDTIENTHPSVVAFPNEWNGYKYWMAITAYPKGDATYENPHIFKSNDMVTWIPDTNNPLDQPKSEKFTKSGSPLQYDSDTHLIFNTEKNQLEMFWRYVDDVNDRVTIFRRDSTDGKTWSNKQVVYHAPRKEADWVSPAFIKDADGYKVWYVADGYRIWYRESQDGFNWSEPIEIKVPYEEKNMKHWHLDVQKTDEGYEMIVVGFKSNGSNSPSERHTMSLYHSVSKDNKNWSTLTPIIYPSQDKKQWDGKGLYRSAFIKENGTYYVFYSGIGFDRTRGVGLSYGADINQLKGINYSNLSEFNQTLK
ncbi:hypothetical protein CBF34_10620 [Vagococcus penaei]|uniref:exo-alpha-sialidase n=1 Tax=Vagococcus penaei TaxID=633807 RepID=UPI000F895449|nr:hypothetical protein [Vagococcus penaei]RST98179.1 hypothetical protein CBF34_10620 [Vagococcus penaei]